MRKKPWRPALTSATLIAIVVLLSQWQLGWLQPLNDFYYDSLLRWRPTTPAIDSRPVFVAIDELSVQQRGGGQPLERQHFSVLCEQLMPLQPGAVVWDVIFSGTTKDDTAFSTALPKCRSVLAFASREGQFAGSPALTLANHGIPIAANDQAAFINHIPLATPAENLTRRLKLGHTASTAHRGGPQRGIALMVKIGNRLYPSLALAGVQQLLGLPDDDVLLQGNKLVIGYSSLQQPIIVPLNERGEMLVNYLPDWSESFYPQSLHNLSDSIAFAADEMADTIAGNLLLVGATWAGSGDFTATPLASQVPGAVVILNAVNTLLTGEFLQSAPFWWVILTTVFLSLLLCLALLTSRTTVGLIISTALIALLLSSSALLFWQRGIFLPVAAPLTAALSTLIALMSWSRATAGREAQRSARVLSRFVSPALLQELETSGADEEFPPPKRRELTVLFADIAGFTAFTDQAEPEEISGLLQQSYDAALKSIFTHEGTLDKLMGDGIIAYWGAPERVEAKEQKAVLCALDLQEKFTAIAETVEHLGGPELKLRCGIATGYVTVGYLGSSNGAAYTIIGRSVNLAARLESNAEPGTIMIEKRTAARVEENFMLAPLPAMNAKGIEQPVKCWRIESAKT